MNFTLENLPKGNLGGFLNLNKAFCLSSDNLKRSEKPKQYKYWTLDDDEKLSKIAKDSNYDWKKVCESFPSRTSAEVEQRWRQRIDPTTKKSSWTKEEDRILLMMHQKFGGKWKLISQYLPGRLPSSIKNRFYGKIYKNQSKDSLISIQEPNLLHEIDDELYIESLLDLSDSESMHSINNHLTSQYNLRLVAE